jgi:AcrR family transcriptional regulator
VQERDLTAEGGVPLQRLPRGRHKLSAETVQASQRHRLLQAMRACVGNDGYEATTVPRVVARARVSRNAFYEHFEDKADCFVAMCEQHTVELLGALTALGDRTDWATALRDGVDIYLRWWQDRPDYCRAFFVELPTAGPRALAFRDRAFEQFGAMFTGLAAWARHSDSDLPPLPARAVALLVYGITELIAQEWRAGRGDALLTLHDDIVDHALRMLAGDAVARDVSA